MNIINILKQDLVFVGDIHLLIFRFNITVKNVPNHSFLHEKFQKSVKNDFIVSKSGIFINFFKIEVIFKRSKPGYFTFFYVEIIYNFLVEFRFVITTVFQNIFFVDRTNKLGNTFLNKIFTTVSVLVFFIILNFLLFLNILGDLGFFT